MSRSGRRRSVTGMADATMRVTFLVEHYRPDKQVAELERFAARARGAVRELEREGQPLRFLRSLILPGDESFLCLVEAASEQLVRDAYDRAGIRFERISPTRVLTDSEME
jgi:Nickel responsive protein SCO4226-like